jgi:hypothetical protein
MNQVFRHRHLLASLGLLGLAALFVFFSTFFMSFEPLHGRNQPTENHSPEKPIRTDLLSR